MDAKDLAFSFCGLTTDQKRREFIQRELGNNPLHHALFARELTFLGHPHDWICYRDAMKQLYGRCPVCDSFGTSPVTEHTYEEGCLCKRP